MLRTWRGCASPPLLGEWESFHGRVLHVSIGGGGGSDGETSFLSGRGAPHGEDIGFDGGFLKKIVGWGRVPPPPHHHKSVNTSLKLILLLEVSLEKHIKSIIV